MVDAALRDDAKAKVGRRALQLLKIIWVGAVICVSGWYLITRWSEIVAYAGKVGLWAAFASFLVVTAGRVLLADLCRSTLRLLGSEISLSQSFYTYTLSQLGKYIPGSVWHLVGRVGLYHQYGLSMKRGAMAVAIDNALVVGSGACVGIGLSVGAILSLANLGPPHGAYNIAALVITVVVWWIVVSRLVVRVLRWLDIEATVPAGRLFVVSLALWASLGFAFWLVLPADSRDLGMLPRAVGSFALAWVFGYVVPFAPAGIGVREAVLVAVLAPVIGMPAAAATATGSRIIWSAQELAFAPLAAMKIAEGDKSIKDESAGTVDPNETVNP